MNDDGHCLHWDTVQLGLTCSSLMHPSVLPSPSTLLGGPTFVRLHFRGLVFEIFTSCSSSQSWHSATLSITTTPPSVPGNPSDRVANARTNAVGQELTTLTKAANDDKTKNISPELSYPD